MGYQYVDLSESLKLRGQPCSGNISGLKIIGKMPFNKNVKKKLRKYAYVGRY